jgi:hypothetical protein
MKAGEVRLDPGTTKNDDGRVFPFTSALRRVLEDQQKVAETLKREQGTIARYVFCYTIGKKTGQRITESGFNKAWRKARVEAGCPGRSAGPCGARVGSSTGCLPPRRYSQSSPPETPPSPESTYNRAAIPPVLPCCVHNKRR